MEGHSQNLTLLLCTKSIHNYLKIALSHFPSLLEDFGKIFRSTDFTNISPEVSCLVLHMQVTREEIMRDFSFLVNGQQAKRHFQINEVPPPPPK